MLTHCPDLCHTAKSSPAPAHWCACRPGRLRHALPAGRGQPALESAANEALNQCCQRGLPVRLFVCVLGDNQDLKKDEVIVYAGEYKVGFEWRGWVEGLRSACWVYRAALP